MKTENNLSGTYYAMSILQITFGVAGILLFCFPKFLGIPLPIPEVVRVIITIVYLIDYFIIKSWKQIKYNPPSIINVIFGKKLKFIEMTLFILIGVGYGGLFLYSFYSFFDSFWKTLFWFIFIDILLWGIAKLVTEKPISPIAGATNW